MASDVSGTSSRDSTRESSRQQAQEARDEGEQTLARVRGEYQKKAADERRSGEATINHIRRSNEEQLDALRSSLEDRKMQETENSNRTYANLKHKTSSQKEGMEQELSNARETHEHNVAQVQDRDQQAMHQSQTKLRDFVQTQNALKSKIQKENNDEIRQVQTSGNEKLTQVKRSTGEELTQAERDHQKKIAELGQENLAVVNKAHMESAKQIALIRKDNETKINQERKTANQLLSDLHAKEKSESGKQRELTEIEITALRKEHADKIRQMQSKAARDETELGAIHTEEIQKIITRGEAEKRTQEMHYDQQLKEQKHLKEVELKKTKEDLQVGIAQAEQESHDKMKLEIDTLENNLKQKRLDFKQRYETDEKANKQSIDNQKDVYLKALYKQKEKQNAHLGVETARESDPFYRMQSFDGHLEDNPTSYVLRAKVAPHEKANLQVHVEKDKVTLAASRSYQDKFKDDDSKIATNSFQTYRQEFKFDEPVHADRIVKRVESDGQVTVTIPKIRKS
jgi:HSP20 family molecular chaperone IbpA